MLVGKDEDNTLSLQRETAEMSSQLENFPKHIHILVVDTNFNGLLDMKKIMMKYSYQVSVETDGEKALAYLTMCKHDINLVVWNYNMPGVHGIQALKEIGSKLDIPVVIMSDDTQSDSLMEAIMSGACAYITKPVPEDIISNMWQHIVRKTMMSEPEALVQSNLAQSSNGLDKGKAVSMVVDQEQDIERKEKNKGKRPWTMWTKVIQLDKPDLVQTNELYQLSDGSTTINQPNEEEEEERPAKIPRKDRMTWEPELHQKFLDAIELDGGIQRASPKGIHEFLEQMNVHGLSRSNVGSHLQKHRMSLEKSQIPKHSQLGLSTTVPRSTWLYQCSNKGLLRNHSKNVQLASSSSSSFLTKALAVNPIQQNQYQTRYLPRNNHQLITNQLSSPFRNSLYQHQPQEEKYQSASHLFDYLVGNKKADQALKTFPHQHQPQKYQSASHLLNYVVGNEQPGQASNTYVDHLRHQHQSQQPLYQSFSHLVNLGEGNKKTEQAFGTYVGPLHQNQQQPHQYQSPHQFNYVVGNEESGQASGTYVGPLHQNQQQPQQYQSLHQFNYVVGNEEHGQASGTYVGPLHQNQQHLQQYQSPQQFKYVVGNEKPDHASGIGVMGLESTYPSVPQPQHYQSPHQFNYVVGNDEPQQASSSYVDLLPQHQPQPQQNQSSHQFNYMMSNEEPDQTSGINITALEPTYPSMPQPQEYQSSDQFNHVMSNDELQQASGIGAMDLELTYPSVPYDLFEDLMDGYNFSE